MRLHPQLSVEEARQWLLREATSSFGVELNADLERAVEPFAESMAAISAVELPNELEPAFP